MQHEEGVRLRGGEQVRQGGRGAAVQLQGEGIELGRAGFGVLDAPEDGGTTR
ncbi:hypothetical protein ACH4MG_04605 [Streptomyces sp. NPDC017454]|uniref:hypothetical protein n=1 Tax=Streptomyces sp. NPDC017454 TaxID=3364997 RepID=UPI00379EC131